LYSNSYKIILLLLPFRIRDIREGFTPIDIDAIIERALLRDVLSLLTDFLFLFSTDLFSPLVERLLFDFYNAVAA
jgi:hypothetical protein